MSASSLTDNYEFFWQSASVYSQWHACEFDDADDVSYTTAEQYMMYKKAKLFGDNVMANAIMKATNPKVIKTCGRQVSNFNEKIWKEHRESIVYNGNLLKFSQNAALKKKLMDTGDKIIVEASPYDKIWGIGMRRDHPDARHPKKWKGLNLLGKCLMDVRRELSP